MSDIKPIIIRSMMDDDIFCNKVVGNIKPEYFDEYEDIIKVLIAIKKKYNKIPKKDDLILHCIKKICKTHDGSFDKDRYETDRELYTKIQETQTHLAENFDMILDETKTFVKQKAVEFALMQSVDIFENGKNTEKIINIINEAYQLNFDDDLGTDYFNDFDRYNIQNTVKYKTGYDELNLRLAGGWSPKTLNIIIGETNIGKTLLLSNFAANLVNGGYDVLYITLEISEDSLSLRIDGRETQFKISTLQQNKDIVINELLKKKDNCGKFIIKEYPPTTITIQDIQRYLIDLRIKKQFTPQIIVIDYLTLMKATTTYTSDNEYAVYKRISEELRKLAVETNTVVLTAGQSNRDSYDRSYVGLKHIADSLGIAYTADEIIVITKDVENDLSDELFCYLRKTRSGEKSTANFKFKVDWKTLRVYEDKLENCNLSFGNNNNPPPVIGVNNDKKIDNTPSENKGNIQF